MKSFENFLSDENLDRLNLEAKVARLNGLVAQIGEGYRRGNEKVKRLPVDSSCRVMMEPFIEVYDKEEVKADIAWANGKEKEWRERDTDKDEKSIGERFELLKTAIFNKFLGNRFVIVRSSRYDDYKNGVDNVMIDIENGNVVCAFDEVGNDSFFKKLKETSVSLKNFENGGASLKYGIELKNGKPVPAKLENLPIFCLSLSANDIKEGIQKMNFRKDQKSEIENKIFEICLHELQIQIAELQKKLPETITKANAQKTASLKRLSEHLALFKESILISAESKFTA